MENTEKENNTEIKEEVLFCCQIEKSTFKKLIKEQSKYALSYSMNILNGILFELKDNILTMVSTDGKRILETEIEVEQPFKSGSRVYDGRYLGAIRFMKNICIKSDCYIDMLQFNFYEDYLEIKDLANGIVYDVPHLVGQFPPNWKSLFPTIKEDDESYTTIGVNMNFINELNKLSVNERTGIVELTIKNGDPLNAILAKCNNGVVQSRVLIMPERLNHEP